jgi:hypothetical protein
MGERRENGGAGGGPPHTNQCRPGLGARRWPQPSAVSCGWLARGVLGSSGPDRTRNVVCDVVLFNASIGHLLVVEAKSGANIEEGQARRLAAIDPQALVIAGGITIPQAVQLRSETLFACLTKHVARITKGISTARLTTPVLAVDANGALWAQRRPGLIQLPESSRSIMNQQRISSMGQSWPSLWRRWPGIDLL